MSNSFNKLKFTVLVSAICFLATSYFNITNAETDLRFSYDFSEEIHDLCDPYWVGPNFLEDYTFNIVGRDGRVYGVGRYSCSIGPVTNLFTSYTLNSDEILNKCNGNKELKFKIKHKSSKNVYGDARYECQN